MFLGYLYFWEYFDEVLVYRKESVVGYHVDRKVVDKKFVDKMVVDIDRNVAGVDKVAYVDIVDTEVCIDFGFDNCKMDYNSDMRYNYNLNYN